MMRKLFMLAVGTFLTSSLFGQIQIKFSGAPYQGDTVFLTGGAVALQTNYLYVLNQTGASIVNAKIMRKKMTEMTGAGDYFCWGTSCYPENMVSPYDPWTTPDPNTIANGDSSLLSLDYDPHGFEGVSQYRYYVLTNSGTKLDSVDVKYTTATAAGITENSSAISFSVYPNPAKGDVYISAPKSVEADFKVVDLLGSVIEMGKVNQGAAHINTAGLNNGIYFVVVGSGKESVAKKIVVRN